MHGLCFGNYGRGFYGGHHVGFNRGFLGGHQVGFNRGASWGYGNGFAQGNFVGYGNGYANGYAQGSFDTAMTSPLALGMGIYGPNPFGAFFGGYGCCGGNPLTGMIAGGLGMAAGAAVSKLILDC